MIHTRICDLLGIVHPIILGGMGTATTAPLVAAVSNAGGFGTLGTSAFNAATLDTEVASIRERTEKPFGINHLLFQIQRGYVHGHLARYDRRSQPLRGRARIRICGNIFSARTMSAAKVMYMAGRFPKLSAPRKPGRTSSWRRAQKPEGMWVGWRRCRCVPMMVKAVAPLPVLSAGGIADGRGLAAALALGAEGVLLGTRFMATPEAPIHPNFKQAIVKSDGHDTVLTEIPDLATQRVWPGAMSRAQRNKFHRALVRARMGVAPKCAGGR